MASLLDIGDNLKKFFGGAVNTVSKDTGNFLQKYPTPASFVQQNYSQPVQNLANNFGQYVGNSIRGSQITSPIPQQNPSLLQTGRNIVGQTVQDTIQRLPSEIGAAIRLSPPAQFGQQIQGAMYPQQQAQITKQRANDAYNGLRFAGEFNPIGNILGGVVNTGIGAVQNVLQKKPVLQNIDQNFSKGFEQSAQFSALSSINPLFAREINNPMVKITGQKVVGQLMRRAALAGARNALESGVVGFLDPQTKNRIKNAEDQALFGAVLGALGQTGGDVGGLALQGLSKQLGVASTKVQSWVNHLSTPTKNLNSKTGKTEHIPMWKYYLQQFHDQSGGYIDFGAEVGTGKPTGKLPQQVDLTKPEIKPQQPTLETPQLTGGELPNNPKVPSSSEIIPPAGGNTLIDPVQRIIEALKAAKPLENAQGKIYSKIRSQQAGAIAGIGKSIPGEAGFHAQLGQMKGEMPKVQFESIRKNFDQPTIDSLFNKIEQTNLSPFEKITAKGGLSKLLGAEGGSVPNKSELNMLNDVFPPEFVQAVLDKRSTIQKLFTLGEGALQIPRAIMATADLSAPLRQGAFLIGRPKQWVPAFANMFKYFGSEKAYQGLQENIKARPTYSMMRESKLAITDMSPILQNREEAFMSNLVENIPGFGKLAKASDRAYSGFLNKLRADTFDSLYKSAKSLGILDSRPDVIHDISDFVNTATGRGNLGQFQRAAPILNGAFFSPRLMASRLNLLSPVYYAELDPFVRKEALKSLFTFAGTGLTVLGLAKAGGAEVGTDPRSADFGKIKFGPTRYDPWAGFQQYIVAASRLLTGQMVSSTTGKEFNLGEGYKPTTRLDIIQRFFESKTSPIASFALDLLKGQTTMGEKVNIPVEVIDRLIPMVLQDMYSLYKQDGPDGIFKAIPGVFGVGSQTYTDQIPMQTKTPTGKPNITWRQQPSFGENILNTVTGTKVSNIPQEQWKGLRDIRSAKTQQQLELNKIKAQVLESGQSQNFNGKNIQLKNGVVQEQPVDNTDNPSFLDRLFGVKKAGATNEAPPDVQSALDIQQQKFQEQLAKQQAQTDGKIQETSKYYYVPNDKGGVQTIEKNRQVTKPTPTGEKELDKKLIAQYKTDLMNKGNDIIDMYSIGKLTKAEAEQKLNELKGQSQSFNKGKAAKKIAASKITFKPIKLTLPKKSKVKTIKISSPSQPKAIKSKAIKIAKTKPIKIKKLTGLTLGKKLV